MEEWRPVPGYEGLYEVSDHGRVKSFDRDVVRRSGKIVRWRGRVLKPNAGSKGHFRVNLFKDSKPEMVYIHQLVAQVFIPNPRRLPLVRHWDDDKANNHVSNLLWGTHSDNRQDAVRNGVRFGSANLEKTHCVNGHPFKGGNLYTHPVTGHRSCRTCKRNHWRKKTGKPLSDPVHSNSKLSKKERVDGNHDK